MISWPAFIGICFALLFFVVGLAVTIFIYCDGLDMRSTLEKSLKRALARASGGSDA
jgi:hypothetical protein